MNTFFDNLTTFDLLDIKTSIQSRIYWIENTLIPAISKAENEDLVNDYKQEIERLNTIYNKLKIFI